VHTAENVISNAYVILDAMLRLVSSTKVSDESIKLNVTCPDAHSTHDDCPCKLWYFPAAQLVHAEAPAALYVPEVQTPVTEVRPAVAQ